MELTHKSLCDIAVKWLKRHKNGIGCNFAVSEIQTSFERTEQADAFGYRCTGHLQGSWLVEVKTSRSDFLADFKKPHREDPTLGVGRYRMYMCPEGVIKEDELPEGWGLVTVNSRGHVNSNWINNTNIRVFEDRNQDGEAYIMARLVSRFDDVEKFNTMLKESSAMASRAWARVEKLQKELKEVRKLKNDHEWYIHHLLERLDYDDQDDAIEKGVKKIEDQLYESA